MKVKILLPTGLLIESEAEKISSQAIHGSFTILPRHVDCVMFLTPGILIFNNNGGSKQVGLDKGVLVKKGQDVFISVHYGLLSNQHMELEDAARQIQEDSNHRYKEMQRTLTKLETSFTKKIMELK